MHRFFKHNFSYRLISIFIAVTLWLWVTIASNPTQEKVLDIPLESEKLADNLMVAEIPDSVKVRIEGRENIVEDITSRDLKAIVNLAGSTVGSNTAVVEVVLPSGVQLVSTTPSQVNVVIDRVEEIQVGVTIETEGKIQDGYVTVTPLATPSEIIIKGPKSLLDTIEDVFVTARIEGYNQTYKETLPVKVRDNKGNYIQEWLRQDPGHVEVYIPIVKDEPSEKILVKPAIIGKPAEGFQIKQVKVEPEFAQVTGTYQILSTLDYLSTETIILEELTTDLIQEVEVVVPDESINISPKTVRVIIQLEEIPE
jgi:YbbR domain-containing protein